MSTKPWATYAEHVVTSIYALDILFKFMKIPADNLSYTHLKIAKKYAGGPTFYLDILATFPFYVFSKYSTVLKSIAPLFKLLRLTKLNLIMEILYYNKWKVIIEFFCRAEHKTRKDAV